MRGIARAVHAPAHALAPKAVERLQNDWELNLLDAPASLRSRQPTGATRFFSDSQAFRNDF